MLKLVIKSFESTDPSRSTSKALKSRDAMYSSVNKNPKAFVKSTKLSVVFFLLISEN